MPAWNRLQENGVELQLRAGEQAEKIPTINNRAATKLLLMARKKTNTTEKYLHQIIRYVIVARQNEIMNKIFTLSTSEDMYGK